MNESRRKFLAQLGGTSALLAATPGLLSALPTHRSGSVHLMEPIRPRSVADTVNIALIGAGIIGHFDLICALKVPGTKVVAVADLYQPRLTRAKEVWGNDIFTTRDYREILTRPDVDAVLICVPDHWHDRISIDAMMASKHVYCEKPMIHRIEEGRGVIEAQRKSGKVFQVGSQRASASAVLEAKKRYEAGDIGELTSVEAFLDRTDALGAWQYTMPPSVDPNDLDWDKFLGNAPKVVYEPVRFFRWRNYKDYGTGVAGDLFVHLITSLHTVTGATGPTRIFSLADLNFWKDGRDAYDLVTALMDYPKTDKHASFQFATRVNLAAGSGGNIHTRLVGTEGVLDIGWNDFTLNRLKRGNAPMYSTGYDALFTYPKATQEEFVKQYNAQYPADRFDQSVKAEPAVTYAAPADYDDRLDHMIVFFNAIRKNDPSMVKEDATFGLRAAAPSLAANLSAEQRRVINWDPVNLKLLKSTV
jgi:predicted dehydrogenase